MAKTGKGEQAPNIKLRAGASPATVDAEVYPAMGNPIIFPNLESQKKGFYHPRAAEIIALYPDRYIPFTDKGGES